MLKARMEPDTVAFATINLSFCESHQHQQHLPTACGNLEFKCNVKRGLFA